MAYHKAEAPYPISPPPSPQQQVTPAPVTPAPVTPAPVALAVLAPALDGQLGHGDGSPTHYTNPSLVSGLHHWRFASAATGDRHLLALTEDGSVLAWGQTRRAVNHFAFAPAAVDSPLALVEVRYVSEGMDASCAVSVSGQLSTWGY